jgi:hypothetical protein
MQNFNDILNGISDGTKDISVNALTVAGAATLNGNITLGNATSDDLTATGRWASNLDPKTAATYDHGTSSQTWRAMYLDNGATDSGAIYFDAGTTKFIKGSADGTTLNIGGFTLIAPVDAEYKGRTTSAAATAGYLGEVKTVDSSTSVGTSPTTLATLALTPGVWLLSGMMRVGADATNRYMICSISNTAATHDTTTGRQPLTAWQTSSGNGSATVPNRVVSISANTNYYLIGEISSTSGAAFYTHHLMAVRIA